MGECAENIDCAVGIIDDLRRVIPCRIDINLESGAASRPTGCINMIIDGIADNEPELVAKILGAVMLIGHATGIDVCLCKGRPDTQHTTVQHQCPVRRCAGQSVLQGFRVRIVRIDRFQQRVTDRSGFAFGKVKWVVRSRLRIPVRIDDRRIRIGWTLRSDGRIVLWRHRQINCRSRAEVI